MTKAITATLILLAAWMLVNWFRRVGFHTIAVGYVRSLQPDVEEGLIATAGNLGVLYDSRVCYFGDPNVVIMHVVASYFRCSYPEHVRVYVVQIDRLKRTVLKHDTIDIESVQR